MTRVTVVCPLVLGRQAEQRAIRTLLAGTRAQRGGVVFLVGEPGIGKTRLAAEARRMAAELGLGALRGRAVQRASPQPYRPLAEAIQAWLPLLDATSDPRLRPFRAALGRLAGGRADEGSDIGELAVAEAIVWLLKTVADQGTGCLLVLEDLHWADPETVAVVEYLSDRLADEPVVCLATVRTGELSEAERLARLLHERRTASMLTLAPLDADATEQMIRACLGDVEIDDQLRRALFDRAEGVPLFVEELVAGLVGSGTLHGTEAGREMGGVEAAVPLSFTESVHRRLDALGPDGTTVLYAAAVLGRRFECDLLSPMTGLGDGRVLDVLRRASAAQLLTADPTLGAFRFRHALTRDAVLAGLLPVEQARLAASALNAVERLRPGLPGESCDLAADLAERAGDARRAVGALVDLARRRLAQGIPHSAEIVLARAEKLVGADPVLALAVDELVARAAALAGDVDRAIQHAASVLAALPATETSRPQRAELHLTLARAALSAGRRADARRHVDDARTLASQGNDQLLAAAEALAAQVAMTEGRLADATTLAESALAAATMGNVPAAMCEALEVLGREARLRDVAEAERHFDRAYRVAERHGLRIWRARALHELGTLDLYAGRRPSRFHAARDAAADAGAVALVALCDLHLCTIAAADWSSAEAVEHGRRCVELSRRLGLSTLGMGLVHLACGYAQLGDAASVEEALAEAARASGDEPDVAAGIPGRALTTLAVRRAQFPEAGRALDDAVTVIRRHPEVRFPFYGFWALLRTIEGRDGDDARCEARRNAGAVVFNHFCLAMADAIDAGRHGSKGVAEDLATARLRDEREAGTRGVWPAIVLGLVATEALRHGWGDGVTWARRALTGFETAGLTELAAWSRAVLREAGEPVPRRGRGATAVPPELRVLGVTSREADVLVLLRDGLTNPQIAARLHLSPRTVDRHVSNLLAKTSTADRRELVGFAAQAGMAGTGSEAVRVPRG